MTLLLIDDGGATEIAAAAIVVIGGHSNDEIEDGSEVTNRDDLHDINITLLLGNWYGEEDDKYILEEGIDRE